MLDSLDSDIICQEHVRMPFNLACVRELLFRHGFEKLTPIHVRTDDGTGTLLFTPIIDSWGQTLWRSMGEAGHLGRDVTMIMVMIHT